MSSALDDVTTAAPAADGSDGNGDANSSPDDDAVVQSICSQVLPVYNIVQHTQLTAHNASTYYYYLAVFLSTTFSLYFSSSPLLSASICSFNLLIMRDEGDGSSGDVFG